MPTRNGGGTSDSRRVPASLSRDYLDNRSGMETLAAAVATADQEAVMRLNRDAIARDYQRQAASLDRLQGVTTGAESMPDDDTEFRVDSPQTTTINNAGVPHWVPLLTALAVGAAGAGVGWGLAQRPATVPQQPPAATGTDTDTDTQYRVILE